MQIGKTVKKIGTLLVGTAMMGSMMVGPAMAANLGNYPAPFATSDDFASTIVVGAAAKTGDVVGAINIAASLAQTGAEAQEVSVSCGSGVTSIENGAKVETKSKKLRSAGANKYETPGAVMSSLSGNDLDLLKKETVTYADGTTTSVDQVLDLTTAGDIQFSETDDAGDTVDSPRLIFDKPTTGALYTYKMTIPSGLDTRDPDASTAGPGFAGETITIMGKAFTVGVQADIASNKLVLYGGGEEKSLTAGGDSVTFTLDGESHTIQMTSWTGTTGSNLKGVFVLDGKTYEKSENSAITVNPETNSQITIKKVSETKMPSVSGGAATESATATIFICSAKLTLDWSVTPGVVKNGDDTIDGAVVTFTNSSATKISSITIAYTPDDQMVAEVGEVLVDPVFGAFEYAFSGYTESDTASRDNMRVYKSSSTKVKLAFENKNNEAFDIDLGYMSGTATWVKGTSSVGVDVVDNPTNIDRNDLFFLSDGENSYIMKFSAIDTTNDIVKIKNMATNEEIEIGYASATGTFLLGSSTYTVSGVDETNRQIDITDADLGVGGAATGALVKMYTKYGHMFTVNAFTGATEPQINITETDDQSDTDKALITIDVTEGTKTAEVDTIDATIVDDAGSTGTGGPLGSSTQAGYSVKDSDVDHIMTEYGTLLVDDTDKDDIKIYLPDEQVTYDVYVMKAGVAAPSTTSTGATTTATVSVSVPTLSASGVAVLDTEASSLKSTSNLILVGGPAVNDLVKELGTVGKVRTLEQWMTQTIPGTFDYDGKGLIQVVDDAFSTGNSVIVVAGFRVADTMATCNVLMNYANYATEFAGKSEVEVVGTTVSDVVELTPVVEEETTEEETTEE